MSALSVWIGLVANRATRQRRAVEALTEVGGQFEYDYQFVPDNRARPLKRRRLPNAPLPIPAWMRGWHVEHYFITPVSLSISDQNWDNGDHLIYLHDLPELESLILQNVRLRQGDTRHFPRLEKLKILMLRPYSLPGDGPIEDFQFLANFPGVANLALSNSEFGDEGVQCLSGLRELIWLQVPSTRLGDAGLAELKDMKQLEMLQLAGTNVTDAGIVHLSALPNLRDLVLSGAKVIDAGIKPLKRLVKLQSLRLLGTQVTKTGLTSLRSALPRCQIETE